MTNPSTTRKTAPAKSTPATDKVADNQDANLTESDKIEEKTDVTPEVKRIPDALSSNSILEDFCKQYLGVFDEISEYNKAVLAEKDSEWTPTKVLAKARELGTPEDSKAPVNESIKAALTEWENAVQAMNVAKRSVLDKTAKELGITLSATSERNPETEAPMKDRRKRAVEIGTQLSMIATMTNDTNAAAAVTEFLSANPLPAIGRDQVHTFGSNGEKATPKYRVNVAVTNADGDKLIEEAGFTKASQALTKYYPRGEAIKSDKMREAWEAAGNNAEKTVTNPVVFHDNDLIFTITKK